MGPHATLTLRLHTGLQQLATQVQGGVEIGGDFRPPATRFLGIEDDRRCFDGCKRDCESEHEAMIMMMMMMMMRGSIFFEAVIAT